MSVSASRQSGRFKVSRALIAAVLSLAAIPAMAAPDPRRNPARAYSAVIHHLLHCKVVTLLGGCMQHCLVTLSGVVHMHVSGDLQQKIQRTPGQ